MTGLFFGSFNPLHNGHLMIAKYMLDKKLCDNLWFVVSPANPHKERSGLLDEKLRLEIVQKAILPDARMQACDIEFTLPVPSYTIHTLRTLSARHPEQQFALIIGEDNLENFAAWKDFREIYAHYHIFVYPRPGIMSPNISYPNMERIAAPTMDISSTQIRRHIRNNADIHGLVPENVIDLIYQYYA